MTKRITYAKESCGRCGGSGRYSFNQRDGDRCYGCSGSGTRLTRAAKSASEKVSAKLDELCSVPSGSIKVGDRVRTHGGIYRPVLEVAPNPYSEDGVLLTYRDVSWAGWEEITHHVAKTDPIRKAPSPEQWLEVLAYASKFKGATIVEIEEKVTA